MVLMTTSFATKPVISEPVASHVPKPAGLKSGASVWLTTPNTLSCGDTSATRPTPGLLGSANSSQITTELIRMMVEALCRKPLVRVQAWRVTLRMLGRR